ncbi:Uncharacterised protein [Mycobacteroides abscessus subsp. abscessus]|nr:Uncharacterised protein [Mycobacteroides abscessus subsp. abscessus]
MWQSFIQVAVIYRKLMDYTIIGGLNQTSNFTTDHYHIVLHCIR